MTAPAALRKLALTIHVTASVGWLGAVVAVLALAATVLTGDEELASASYVAMDALGWTVLVPLALASLVTGVVQSLVTPWGLFRHYWVVVKLALTLVATGVLLLYTGTLGRLAAVADAAGGDALPRSASPLVHSVAALAVLGGAVVLSVYKPRGLTRRGWRLQQAARTPVP